MKQVQKTQEIISLLKSAFGADINSDDYAVFEATALNNLPIRKKHPLYEGAVAQDSLLADLAARINAESAPLQQMHQGGALPSGRVFHAQKDGAEVRALFALSNTTDADLVSKIDQGIIDQVSVNVLPKQILCSECGWDYLGADSGFDNVYLGVCANDHQLRQDGVRANLHGLDLLSEVSLVNMGGAQGARIQPRDKQYFAAPEFQRLAASGHSPALLLAEITPDLTPQGNTDEMDLTSLVADLTTQKAAVLTLTAERDAATTRAEAAEAALSASATDLAAAVTARETAEAALSGGKPAPEVVAFLQDLAKRTEIALGNQTPEVGDDPAALIASISAGQSKLSALIPPGGAALTAETDVEASDGSYAPKAFRTAGAR